MDFQLLAVIFTIFITITYCPEKILASIIHHRVDGIEETDEDLQRHSQNNITSMKGIDAMADILYENRNINKEIAEGTIDQVLIEGDIYVPHSDENRSRRTITKREGMKWPGAVVPYLVDPHFTDKEKRVLFNAMQRFHEISCIKFRRRTLEPDYLFITPGKGCWSMVGRQGGVQKMSLMGTCKFRKGTIMHELMHCLGFRHEHNRPDRDSFIRILWHNIKTGYSENFIKHTESEVDTMNSRYDYFSIMHYPLTAFSDKGDRTIQPLKLYSNYGAVGSRHDFSNADVERLNKLYQCGACTDSDELYCPVWAVRGECVRNEAWMTAHCPFSCEVCPERRGNRIVSGSSCTDKNDNCADWAERGECTRNPTYMESYCRESCSRCYEVVEAEGDVCIDSNINCPVWAEENLCQTHSEWMLPNCKKSCRVCAVTNEVEISNLQNDRTEILDETIHPEDIVAGVNADAECTDRHKNCTLWAKEGDCHQFPDWMRDKCPVSCLLCSRRETDMRSLKNMRKVKCKDKKKKCGSWAHAGECEKYEHWMTINCPVSCNTCGTLLEKTCVDKEKKCSTWATKKECRKNKGWFLPNCQYSCNACQKEVPSCVDKNRSCMKKAKKGGCERRGKLRRDCPYSCNLCENI